MQSCLRDPVVQVRLEMTASVPIVSAILIADFAGGYPEQSGKDAGHPGEGWLLTLGARLPPGLAAQWPAGGIFYVPECVLVLPI